MGETIMVYVVTCGSYSDKCVKGVFSSSELADNFVVTQSILNPDIYYVDRFELDSMALPIVQVRATYWYKVSPVWIEYKDECQEVLHAPTHETNGYFFCTVNFNEDREIMNWEVSKKFAQWKESNL